MQLEQGFLDQQLKRLEEERSKLEGILDKIAVKGTVEGDFNPKIEDLGPGMEDEVAEYENADVGEAKVQALEKRLRAVSQAITRIGDGSYGTCIKTDKPIPKERLEADPSAATVVDV